MTEQTLAISVGVVRVPLRRLHFSPWRGKQISDTYGNKAVIDWNGEPLFAELAILKQLRDDGWDGVWVDSYRRCFRQQLPPASCQLPTAAHDLYWKIVAAKNGRRGGCWDVFAWRANRFRFVESKRLGRDAIRTSQIAWLEAAMQCGLTIDSFEVVEWVLE